MSARDLLKEPLWRADDLGLALPDSVHAVSVSLPRWEDVVGYEEKKPEVMARLQSGYPRFVIHPLVREVAQRLGGSEWSLPFPSARVAQMCADYIHKISGEHATAGGSGAPRTGLRL